MTYTRIIGVDVASEKLDICDSNGKLVRQIKNSFSDVERALVAKIRDRENTLVVCEGTGGYEHVLVDSMLTAGIPVAIANPRQVRDFAKGHGRLEKTDRIDANMIMRFGRDVDVHLAKPKTKEEKHLQSVNRRRNQLKKMISQEQNRIAQTNDEEMIECVRETVKHLKNKKKRLENEIGKILRARANVDPNVNRMIAVVGIGPIFTSTAICDLPELGKISGSKITKLVGIAPIANQSGKQDRKRLVRGGRSNVRTVLYMATMSAKKHNPVIREFYDRLIAKGKPHKVAMVACMRKLLTMLNAMIKAGEDWKEPVINGKSWTTAAKAR